MSFISKDLLKDVKNKLEKVIKLKGLLEAVDGFVIGFGLDYVDDNYSDAIPVKYQDEVILLLQAFVNEDYDLLTDALSSAIDEIVDLPFADDDATAKFLSMNIKMLKDFIIWIATKEKEV